MRSSHARAPSPGRPNARVPAPADRPGPRARQRPFLLVPAAILLVLFGLVTGWRLVGTLAEAARGATYTRPRAAERELPSPRADPALQQSVDALALSYPGVAAIAIADLRTGTTASVQADRVFPAASLFKLPVLVEVLKEIRLGRLQMDRAFTVQQDQWTDGSGVLQARVGDRVRVDELLRLLVQESDNMAALVLLDAVGVQNANATMRSIGLTATRLRDRRTEPDAQHTTSAGDMARLMTMIGSGTLIDAQTSEDALKLLELQQTNNWLAEGLPWWVKLAHKWGDIQGARHDAGIIFSPRATYVAVVLTEGGDPVQARRLISRAARLAFDQLGG